MAYFKASDLPTFATASTYTFLFTNPISQSATDEIAKLVTGALLTMLSKWLYEYFDGKRKKRRERKKQPVTPDSITINSTNDEKKISKEVSGH